MTPLVSEAPIWQLRAACRGLGPDWFYGPDPDEKHPGRRRTEELIDRERMQQVCGRCPVQEECFVCGLETEDHGAWGGRTEQELFAIRIELGIQLEVRDGDEYKTPTGRRHKRIPCGSNAGYQQHRRLEETICESCRIAHNHSTADEKARRMARNRAAIST